MLFISSRAGKLLLLISIIALYTGCERSCPECPTVKNSVSDYNVYIGGWQAGEPIVIYNTKAMAIIDTIYLDNSIRVNDLAVSADGQYVLITTGLMSQGRSIIYDKTFTDTVKSLPFGDRLVVSNTGAYVAMLGPDADSLVFLDGRTFDPVFGDNRKFMNGHFTLDDSLFYCVSHTNQIFIYDMSARALDTIIEYNDFGSTPSITDVLPSPTRETLYLLASLGTAMHWIASYDPVRDSVLLRYYIGPPGAGGLEYSPDGKWVIVTDPGLLDIEEPGSQDVIFIDAQTDAVVSLIPAIFAKPGGSALYPGEIAITPDSRYTIVANADWQSFGMIDNDTREFVDFEYKSVEGATFKKVACQKTPK